MLSTPYVHAEFGFLRPTPRLPRLVRLAFVSILLGAAVFALGRGVYRKDGALVVAQTIQTAPTQADDKPTLAPRGVTTRVDDKSTLASQGTDKNLAVISEVAAPMLAQNVPTKSITPANGSKQQRAPSHHRRRN